MANAIVLEVLEFVRPIRLQTEPVSLQQVGPRHVQRPVRRLVTRALQRIEPCWQGPQPGLQCL